MTELHPVAFDKEKQKWITASGEHNSWLEAMQSVKQGLSHVVQSSETSPSV